MSKIRKDAELDSASSDQTAHAAASYEDFIEWLAVRAAPEPRLRNHLRQRAEGKNNMQGHVYHAFNGALAFLRKNPGNMQKLRNSADETISGEVLADLKEFIENFGDEYRGLRGGYWRNYLSKRIGGRQVSGGAGDIVVKKTLLILPHYIRHRGIQTLIG